MPTFGGFSPFPLRFGGGRRRLQTLYEALNQSLGSGYDTSDSSTVTAETMAQARALDAAYSGNRRMAYVMDPARCPAEIVPRLEFIFGIRPHRSDTLPARRRVLAAAFLVLNGNVLIEDVIATIAGSSFIGIEIHPLSTATIRWPVNGYPNSWTSSVAHITIRVQIVANQTMSGFWNMRATLRRFLRGFLPAYVDFDIAIFDSNGGPCFLLDEPNLDLETFCH